jgi:hypothetical protein
MEAMKKSSHPLHFVEGFSLITVFANVSAKQGAQALAGGESAHPDRKSGGVSPPWRWFG